MASPGMPWHAVTAHGICSGKLRHDCHGKSYGVQWQAPRHATAGPTGIRKSHGIPWQGSRHAKATPTAVSIATSPASPTAISPVTPTLPFHPDFTQTRYHPNLNPPRGGVRSVLGGIRGPSGSPAAPAEGQSNLCTSWAESGPGRIRGLGGPPAAPADGIVISCHGLSWGLAWRFPWRATWYVVGLLSWYAVRVAMGLSWAVLESPTTRAVGTTMAAP